MDMLTLYNAIRNGIADDAAIKAWCQANYSQNHKVYAGMDDREPPDGADCPYVYIYMESKQVGYQLEKKGHAIGIITEIYKEGTTAVTGKSNITAQTGVIHNEEFRKLIETSVIGVLSIELSEDAIEQIDITYEDSDPYPYFRSYMGFSINENYYQGSDVFE